LERAQVERPTNFQPLAVPVEIMICINAKKSDPLNGNLPNILRPFRRPRSRIADGTPGRFPAALPRWHTKLSRRFRPRVRARVCGARARGFFWWRGNGHRRQVSLDLFDAIRERFKNLLMLILDVLDLTERRNGLHKFLEFHGVGSNQQASTGLVGVLCQPNEQLIRSRLNFIKTLGQLSKHGGGFLIAANPELVANHRFSDDLTLDEVLLSHPNHTTLRINHWTTPQRTNATNIRGI
jgi:hypothetical protein